MHELLLKEFVTFGLNALAHATDHDGNQRGKGQLGFAGDGAS